MPPTRLSAVSDAIRPPNLTSMTTTTQAHLQSLALTLQRSGGDGNDLTLYLQTAADGLVSFAVSTQIGLSGGNYVRFTLPADAQALLDNISTGDRFIFALARPAPVPVDHAVDAGSVAWSFALPQPTVTHTADVMPSLPTIADQTGTSARRSPLPCLMRQAVTRPSPMRLRGHLQTALLT